MILSRGLHMAQALTVEEAKERRERMAKMRSLLFAHEQKAKRLKAIKSKGFHRHAKKAAKMKARLCFVSQPNKCSGSEMLLSVYMLSNCRQIQLSKLYRMFGSFCFVGTIWQFTLTVWPECCRLSRNGEVEVEPCHAATFPPSLFPL